MHGVDRRWCVLSLVILFGLVGAATCLSGCAHNTAPPGWHPPALVALRSTHGGWIRVEGTAASGAQSPDELLTEGELIAVDQTAFHVLTQSGFQSVPRASVRRITLTGYGNRARTLALWSVLGGVSTLSHGFYLLFTAPTWAVGGVVASLKEKHASIWHDEDVAFRFARFPQGLPSGFDPKTLGALPDMTAQGQ
jgi:hypothetical protein